MARDILNQNIINASKAPIAKKAPLILREDELIYSKEPSIEIHGGQEAISHNQNDESLLYQDDSFQRDKVQDYCNQQHSLNSHDQPVSKFNQTHITSPMVKAGKRRGIKSSPKLPQAFREVIQNQHSQSKIIFPNPFSNKIGSHLENLEGE